MALQPEKNGVESLARQIKHTGRSYDDIEGALERDNFMTADVAKEFGLIDRVIESRDSIEPEEK